MTTKTELPPVPPALADVALIDGPTCAAAGGISISTWHELVRVQAAPQPVIRAVRCTRWRLADVRAWLIERAKMAAADTATAEQVTARAKRASVKAREPAAVAKAKATRAARAKFAANAAGA